MVEKGNQFDTLSIAPTTTTCDGIELKHAMYKIGVISKKVLSNSISLNRKIQPVINMKSVGAYVVLFTAFAPALFGAAENINTDKIDAAIDQLNCASNAIYQINGKYDLGELWFEIYFPIVMHINTIYGCQDEKTQESSDKCVDDEMLKADLTFVEFVQNVRKNNTQASEEVLKAITLTCKIDMLTLEDMDELPDIQFNRIQFNKLVDIKHIACVVEAIAIGLADSDLAKEWLSYNAELVRAIDRIIVCKKANIAKRNVCLLTEFQSTARVLIKFWNFLSQKKHVTMIREIKAAVQNRCSSQVLLL